MGYFPGEFARILTVSSALVPSIPRVYTSAARKRSRRE
jgi:hypothetical protein